MDFEVLCDAIWRGEDVSDLAFVPVEEGEEGAEVEDIYDAAVEALTKGRFEEWWAEKYPGADA